MTKETSEICSVDTYINMESFKARNGSYSTLLKAKSSTFISNLIHSSDIGQVQMNSSGFDPISYFG